MDPAPSEGRLAGTAHGVPAGVGVGWRPEIAGWVAGVPGLAFCEVIAETLAPAVPPRGVAELRERGLPVIPHGVRLSLGGTDALDAARVTHLAACATAVDAPLVSEHIAFVRAGGRDAGHLLPVPRTREALDVLTANVRRTQAELDVPLALEPIAAFLDWPENEYTEAEFLTELLDRTGALLLLDVANMHANAVNRGLDPHADLDRLPLDRIAYVHVAGGAERDGLYHDTHSDPVPAAVLGLLESLVERLPCAPPVMLERDGRYPPAAQLTAELNAIAAAAGCGATPCRDAPGSGVRVAALDSLDETTDLARRQSELVAALVADAAAPAGFDPTRVDATRRALLRKRAGEAATVWPLLAASLGEAWNREFATHRSGHEPVGSLRDGWHVARAFDERGELSAEAAAELAHREAELSYDGRTTPRRRRLARLHRALAARRAG